MKAVRRLKQVYIEERLRTFVQLAQYY